ncbi:MAG: hypothetical protein OXD50_08635 [Chloroflexi bacterium]|nr:hypothetical protein [Chloroflexota bacterium]
MTARTGPTPEDIDEYGTISDDDPTVDMQFNTETSVAEVELTHEQTHLLVEAGKLVGEYPIAFMRNAALTRAAELLSTDETHAQTTAAGD